MIVGGVRPPRKEGYATESAIVSRAQRPYLAPAGPFAVVSNPDTFFKPRFCRRNRFAGARGVRCEGGVPLYGVNFISSAELLADAEQYANGLATGAQWNRWPVYWFNIEQSPGNFDWSRQDAAVQGDVIHGLHTNAILLGTPPFYTTAGAERQGAQPAPKPIPRPGTLALYATETAKPAGLDAPVFSDGSDRPGPGKTINPENKWALFVYTAVNRYKPGGALAQRQRLAGERGRHPLGDVERA
jgi:hypothetical protein